MTIKQITDYFEKHCQGKENEEIQIRIYNNKTKKYKFVPCDIRSVGWTQGNQLDVYITCRLPENYRVTKIA